MNLDDIWEEFTDRNAEVELLLRKTKDSIKTEFKTLIGNEKVLEELVDLDDFSIPTHSMPFRNIKDGEVLFYCQTSLSIEENKKHILRRKNRQYQWLLEESYEAFEHYLARLYAFLGLNGNN